MIKTHSLIKTYDIGEIKVQALRGIDLEVAQGEFIAIMGPSGSGKSTLLHLLGALDRPTSGEVFIDGHEISNYKEDDLSRIRSTKIGFVYQFHNLLPNLSALENVELPMIFIGVSRSRRREKAKNLLIGVGIGDRLHHKPGQLSGGQQQRVAVARAMANDPSVILGDEPTGELDSKTSEEILRIFKELRDERGLTLIIVTHDPGVAVKADRIIKIKDGKVEEG